VENASLEDLERISGILELKHLLQPDEIKRLNGNLVSLAKQITHVTPLGIPSERTVLSRLCSELKTAIYSIPYNDGVDRQLFIASKTSEPAPCQRDAPSQLPGENIRNQAAISGTPNEDLNVASTTEKIPEKARESVSGESREKSEVSAGMAAAIRFCAVARSGERGVLTRYLEVFEETHRHLHLLLPDSENKEYLMPTKTHHHNHPNACSPIKTNGTSAHKSSHSGRRKPEEARSNFDADSVAKSQKVAFSNSLRSLEKLSRSQSVVGTPLERYLVKEVLPLVRSERDKWLLGRSIDEEASRANDMESRGFRSSLPGPIQMGPAHRESSAGLSAGKRESQMRMRKVIIRHT